MTARGLLTRLAFSLVLAAGMAPWAVGGVQHVNLTPMSYQTWTPYSYGPDMHHYLGPIEPYAPDSMPADDTYNEYYQDFLPPRINPALPGSVPAPWQLPAQDFDYRQPYYGPFAYPPPFYGGFYNYYPPAVYPWYYGYPYGWHGELRIFAKPNSQAPTEVPRGR